MAKRVKDEGLEYIEELVFENGAVYKGTFIDLIMSVLNISLFRVFKVRVASWAWHSSMARWS
jgi:hypothetical protein